MFPDFSVVAQCVSTARSRRRSSTCRAAWSKSCLRINPKQVGHNDGRALQGSLLAAHETRGSRGRPSRAWLVTSIPPGFVGFEDGWIFRATRRRRLAKSGWRARRRLRRVRDAAADLRARPSTSVPMFGDDGVDDVHRRHACGRTPVDHAVLAHVVKSKMVAFGSTPLAPLCRSRRARSVFGGSADENNLRLSDVGGTCRAGFGDPRAASHGAQCGQAVPQAARARARPLNAKLPLVARRRVPTTRTRATCSRGRRERRGGSCGERRPCSSAHRVPVRVHLRRPALVPDARRRRSAGRRRRPRHAAPAAVGDASSSSTLASSSSSSARSASTSVR